MGARRPPRHVWVEEIMGMPVSVHVRSTRATPGPGTEQAVQDCFSELREIDRLFSTYRRDSDVSRIGRGELTVRDADPLIAVVESACRVAQEETHGLFSAHWRGTFDPTGYVKGWAVERTARRHLAALVEHEIAVGINAGGDLQLFTAADADWQWNVGIADPQRPGAAIATLGIRDGAVATSGHAERGAHIIDPRSGRAAIGVASATVVADGLTQADVWATAAVVAGFDDRAWIATAGTRTGILLADDGRVARWLGPTQIDIVAAAA